MSDSENRMRIPQSAAPVDPEQPMVVHPNIHGTLVDDPSDISDRGSMMAGNGGSFPPDSQPSVGSVIPDAPKDPKGGSIAPPELATSDRRALSLDALRGLFLVTMTFGFTIASEKLPLWMYHRQFVPPGETFLDVAGLTWRDMAYASFLFTMAAALPLTLARRMDRGEVDFGILFSTIRRFGMLLLFALLIGHANTFFTGYNQPARAMAIVGFAVMALVFTRRRSDWNPRVYNALNILGWVGAAAFLIMSPWLYGKQFSFARIDDIIDGLAFAALTGSVIWYFTREHLNLRLAILALSVALYLSTKHEGWVQDMWWSSAVPWLFSASRLSLFAVVIPGTIAGDALLAWMRSGAEPMAENRQWGNGRILALVALCVLITPIIIVGFYNRWVLETTQLVVAMVVTGLFMTLSPSSSTERLLARLFGWAALWLVLGLFLEPSEGGIKKVPETLSYFFTVTGAASMLLVAMTALVDALKKRKVVNMLIDVGHNPMLCYVLFTVLINSILELIPAASDALQGSTGEVVLRSSLLTVVVMLIVQAVTRRRIFWRT